MKAQGGSLRLEERVVSTCTVVCSQSAKMSCRITGRVSLWVSLQFATLCWVTAFCDTPFDINHWQTSGICVRSQNDMADCGANISNIFVPDDVGSRTTRFESV